MLLPSQLEPIIKELVEKDIQALTIRELKGKLLTNLFDNQIYRETYQLITLEKKVYSYLRFLKETKYILSDFNSSKIIKLNYETIKQNYPKWFKNQNRKV